MDAGGSTRQRERERANKKSMNVNEVAQDSSGKPYLPKRSDSCRLYRTGSAYILSNARHWHILKPVDGGGGAAGEYWIERYQINAPKMRCECGLWSLYGLDCCSLSCG